MNSKHTKFTGVHLLLISAAAVIIGYFAVQNLPAKPIDTETRISPSQQPTASPTAQPTFSAPDTSDWKKYSNQKYFYEFRYPPEARLSNQSDEYVAVSFMGNKQKASGRTQTELFDGYAFNVADVTGDGYDGLDDFVAKKITQLQDICSSVGDPIETTIDGIRAITQKVSCLGDSDNFYFERNNRYFEIGLLHVGDPEDVPSYTKTVRQILSTFTFSN